MRIFILMFLFVCAGAVDQTIWKICSDVDDEGGNYKKDKSDVENDDFVKMWCRYMLYGRKKYTSPTPSAPLLRGI